MPMNARQKLFVQEYLKDLNQGQAAARAGYKGKNIDQVASRLMQKPHIKAAIDEAMAARAKRTEITVDRVLKELARVGFVDIAKAYDTRGNLLPVAEMPASVRRAVSSIKVFEEFEGFGEDRVKVGEVRELKIFDKIKALELIGKHLGMFIERHGDPDGKPLAPSVIILPSNGREVTEKPKG